MKDAGRSQLWWLGRAIAREPQKWLATLTVPYDPTLQGHVEKGVYRGVERLKSELILLGHDPSLEELDTIGRKMMRSVVEDEQEMGRALRGAVEA